MGSYSFTVTKWSIDELDNGDSATLTVTATVDEGTAGSIINNVASATAVDQVDPNNANDTA